MKTTYDGYEIAEKDLLQRGPGDFFLRNSSDNIRQSGGFEFHFASKNSDTKLYEAAFSAAKSIALHDPELKHPDHIALKNEIHKKVNPDNSIFS
jgi:ATP-dependent DNA helicase RecG